MHELKCEYTGETFTDACANTIQFQCIAVKMNSDLALRLFEMCVCNWQNWLSGDLTFHHFSTCVLNIKDNTGRYVFSLVQQCSGEHLSNFLYHCSNGLYYLSQESINLSFHEQNEKFFFHTHKIETKHFCTTVLMAKLVALL